MNARNAAIIPWLLVVLVILAVLAFAPKARAHEPYSDWRVPNNPAVSCCNGDDCRPTRAYMGDDGLWRAWVGPGPKDYLIVPADRLLPTDLAKDGRSHLCEKAGWIYCFSPGEPRI